MSIKMNYKRAVVLSLSIYLAPVSHSLAECPPGMLQLLKEAQVKVDQSSRTLAHWDKIASRITVDSAEVESSLKALYTPAVEEDKTNKGLLNAQKAWAKQSGCKLVGEQ